MQNKRPTWLSDICPHSLHLSIPWPHTENNSADKKETCMEICILKNIIKY